MTCFCFLFQGCLRNTVHCLVGSVDYYLCPSKGEQNLFQEHMVCSYQCVAYKRLHYYIYIYYD